MCYYVRVLFVVMKLSLLIKFESHGTEFRLFITKNKIAVLNPHQRDILHVQCGCLQSWLRCFCNEICGAQEVLIAGQTSNLLR